MRKISPLNLVPINLFRIYKGIDMKIILIYAVLLFVNISCFGVVTEKEQQDKMIFIKVNIVEGKPAEINYEILPGKIKTPKVATYFADDIFYEILDAENSIIADGVVKDPSLRNYEYVNEKGELNTINVKRDSSEVIVRVNYEKNISKINLYRVPEDNSLRKDKHQFIQIGSFPIKID